jgi:hypothetical protein
MTLPVLPPRQGGTGLTSLAALPISTAQQTAFDLKADKSQLATPSVQRFSVADGNLTAGQTSITVSAYTPGTVMAFINGNKLPTNTYTATSGTTVVLADPVQAPDVVEILSWLMSGVQNAAPISHQHSTADLTGPALPVALGGLGNGTGDASALKALATGATTARTFAERALDTMSFADFGCALNGTTADAVNAQLALNWLGSGPNRRLILPHNKILRVDAPLTLNCNGWPNLRLEMYGPMTPDNGIGDMLTIFNTEASQFHLNVESGGGPLVDYSQADPVGAQQAFVLRGTRSCTFDVRARGYAGRAVRTKVQNGGENKSSAHSIRIICEDGAGGFKVAQALYAQGTTFWGSITELTHPTSNYPVIFDALTDLTLRRIEGPNVELRDCGSVWGDVLSLGDGSGTGTNLKFTRNAGGSGCNRIAIDKVLCVGGAIGVHLDRLASTGSGAHIGAIHSVGCTSQALLIEDSADCDVTVYSVSDANAVKLTGTGTHDITLKLKVLTATQQAVVKDAGVARVNISGHVNGAATSGTTACMTLLGNDLGIVVDGLQFKSSTGTAVFELDSTNQVFIDGGSYSGFTTFATNQPYAMRNIQGYKTEASGSAAINAGSGAVVVTHGLASTPDNVIVTPRSVTDGKDIGCSALGATTFAINIPTNAVSSFTVYWRASFGRTSP